MTDTWSENLVARHRKGGSPLPPAARDIHANTARSVRASGRGRHLVAERGWPRRAVVVKPFWAPGRRGLD